MPRVFFFTALLFALPGGLLCAAQSGFKPQIDEAFSHLYSSDFSGSHQILDRYISHNPADALGYAVQGSAYLFSELDRLGILQSEFFESDKAISDSRKRLKPDAHLRESFYQNIQKAEQLAQSQLNQHPDDPDALFTMCVSLGNEIDYLALIEKRQFQSLSLTKRAYRDAKRLLAIDPTYYDSYLTTGFTEYIIGSLPAVVRWFVKFDDLQADKRAGFHDLHIAADKGHYLKTFAKILLATAYLRENQPQQSEKLLRELTRDYPGNALLRKELEKVSARVKAGA